MLKKSTKKSLTEAVKLRGTRLLLTECKNEIRELVMRAVTKSSIGIVDIALNSSMSNTLLHNVKALGCDPTYIEIELEKIRFLFREV